MSSKSKDRLSESQSVDRLKQLLTLSSARSNDGFVDVATVEEDTLSLGGLSRQSSQVDLVASFNVDGFYSPRSSLGQLPVEVLGMSIRSVAVVLY